MSKTCWELGCGQGIIPPLTKPRVHPALESPRLADEAPTPVLFLAALELTLLLLALCFPGALPEVGFLMVALLAIAHFKRDVWQHLFTELGDKKLKSESDSALDSRRLAHRNLQSLFLELLLLLSVNVAASFVKFSPWIAEACSAALIADAVRALLQTAGTPQVGLRLLRSYSHSNSYYHNSSAPTHTHLRLLLQPLPPSTSACATLLVPGLVFSPFPTWTLR